MANMSLREAIRALFKGSDQEKTLRTLKSQNVSKAVTMTLEHNLQESDNLFSLTNSPSRNTGMMALSTVSILPSFQRFNELPHKARLRIWRYAQPNGRLVHITCTTSKTSETHKHSCNSVHPNIIFVNRESREETLRSYSKLQVSGLCLFFNPHRDVYYHHCTRFHWDLFTWPDELLKSMPGALYFPSAHPPIRDPPEEFKIRRLAVSSFGVDVLLRQFLKLELDEILILCGSEKVLKGKKFLTVESARVLRTGQDVKTIEGWGNAVVQNRLMRGIKDQCLELGDQQQVPIVKIVQVSQVSNSDDSNPSNTRLTSRRQKK